ncbi:hypothetical protein BXO88_01425 [Oribacterium sp. C9]|uniref:hypothetical protein n=1 Tax=Oribacterium sp. C9 TaxID=1943579 RepID=UPI000990077D|nr:hypothetical protein [Oribacterium sp. C9]OON88479.1 hypothetical protein BXO88_01425 [Oribacterium sp. C9]
MTYDDEMEIDLIQLFLLCLRKWKTILITAVVLGVILAGYKGGKGLASLRAASAASTESDEEISQDQYDAGKAAYDEQIKLLDDMIKENNAYKESSVLMNLDSNDYFSAGSMYYVKTDYQIMPEMSIQNDDYTDDVVDAYITYINSNECLSYIKSQLKEDLSLRNLKELIKVTKGVHSINVEVYGDSAELVDGIMAALDEAVMNQSAQIGEKVHAHELSLLGKTKADNVSGSAHEKIVFEDKNLKPVEAGYVKAKQTDFANLQNSLITQRDAALTMKSRLTEPTEGGTASSLKSVLKSAVKFGIIGGVAGAFLAAFIICLKAIIVDTVNNASEITRLFGIRVFGDYKSGKSTGKCADMLYRMSYGDASPDKADFIGVLTANIDAYVEAFKDKEINEISFVGRLKTEDMKEIVSSVNSSESSELLKFAGDILTDSEAIRTISDRKYAIVAVDRNTTKNDFRKQLEKLQGLEKTVIGAVLFD